MTNKVLKIYTDIAELLNVARAKTYHVVNSIMVETYWKIGQRIVEEEQGGTTCQGGRQALRGCVHGQGQ